MVLTCFDPVQQKIQVWRICCRAVAIIFPLEARRGNFPWAGRQRDVTGTSGVSRGGVFRVFWFEATNAVSPTAHFTVLLDECKSLLIADDNIDTTFLACGP